MLISKLKNSVLSNSMFSSKNNIFLTNIRFLASFTARDFSFEQSHGETGTLISRFIRHIALINCSNSKIVPNKIKYSQFYPVHDNNHFLNELKKTESDQLMRLAVFTTNYRTNADVQKLVRVINELDNEYARRISELPSEDILQLMYTFMYLIPNKITRLDFYKNGIRKLVNDFESSQNKDGFVQICFYLGLSKKNKLFTEMLHHFLEANIENFMQEMTIIDIAIVANAAFKSSVKILKTEFTSKLKQSVLNIVNDDVDIPLLITFAKSLRHNRIKSDAILTKIETLLLDKPMLDIEFKGYIHLFALFADNLFTGDKLNKFFVQKCMNIIKEEAQNIRKSGRIKLDVQDFRQKDLATFLWCCSYLNISLTEQNLDDIAVVINHKIKHNEYKYNNDDLIESALSLWMLNCKRTDIAAVVMANSPIFFKNQNPDRVKLDSRYHLLRTCLEIEAPEVLESSKSYKIKLDNNAPEYLIKNRPSLIEVAKILDSTKEKINVTNIHFTIPIKHLNIASIFVERARNGRNFCLEIMDRTNSLADLETPTGLLQLKLRLLESAGCETILINTNNCTSDQLSKELHQILQNDKLKLGSDSDTDDEIQGVIK